MYAYTNCDNIDLEPKGKGEHMDKFRKISVFLLVFLLVFSFPVKAEEANTSEDYSITVGNEILVFEDQAGIEAYYESQEIKNFDENSFELYACLPGDLYYPTCKPGGGIGTTTDNLVKKVSLEHQWVGYSPFTPVWQMVSQHSLSSTRSFNASLSHKSTEFGFTLSIGVSFTAGSVFPADATKYSKIGGYADFNYQVREIINRDKNGVITSRGKYATKPVVTDRYLRVVYK